MSGIWDLLIPTAGTNLITNPSFETNTTGWAVPAGSITRTIPGNLGIWCALVTDSAAWFDSVSLTNGLSYVGSMYVKSTAGATITLSFADTSGAIQSSAASLTGTTDWQKLATSEYSATASANYLLHVQTSDSAGTLYIDNAMVVNSSSDMTYIDGDQENCIWNGPKHASTSTRPATARTGGVWTDLQDLGVFVTGSAGLGIADHQITVSEFTGRGGGEVRNVRTPSSNFTLMVSINGSSLSDLHSKRDTFINYLRPNRYGKKNKSPIYLRYRGESSNVIIKAYQEGGLSFSRTGGDGFTEETGIRFVREDETLAREQNNSIELTRLTSVVSSEERNILYRKGGQWNFPAQGLNNDVYAVEYAPDGTLYAGGIFTATGDTSGAIELSYAAKFNGDTWANVGNKGFDNFVRAIKVDAAGTVIFGGDFTAAGDTSGTPPELRRIASYGGDTFSALGAGFTDGGVYALAMDANGNLYAAGSFTGDSDGKELRRVAKWAIGADTWASLGAGFSNGIVRALAVDASGNLYAGGTFTADSDGGTFVNSLAKLAAGADTWATITGVNDTAYVETPEIYALEAVPNGSVYIGGYFKTAQHTNFCEYNGNAIVSSFAPKPSISTVVNGLKYDPAEGLLYMAINNVGLSLLNGNTRMLMDMIGTSETYNCITIAQGIPVLGGAISSSVVGGYKQTITVKGSGNVYPKLTLLGSSIGATNFTLYWLENHTTHEKISFTLPILNAEIVEIDFKTGNITSSIGRNLYNAVNSGSDWANFSMVSGDNDIEIFAINGGIPYAILSWTEQETGL